MSKYIIDHVANPNKLLPIQIDVTESFKLANVKLEGGVGLDFVRAESNGIKLVEHRMKLASAVTFLKFARPEIAKGSLTLVIANPTNKPVQFKVTIE
jgi:hypothetical protein